MPDFSKPFLYVLFFHDNKINKTSVYFKVQR